MKMKTRLLLLFVILSLSILFIDFNKVRETFIDMSYGDCIRKGYTKEFCVQTPVSVIGPSVCTCRDGSIGRILPGFRGECVNCGSWYL